MTETELMQRIQRAANQRDDMRLFRNQVGLGYQGRVVSETPETITLAGWRRVRYGLVPGSADLIGWRVVDGVAQFASVEVKTAKGRVDAAQQRWLDAVNRFGGWAIIARAEHDLPSPR
jgi:hypothetical protein